MSNRFEPYAFALLRIMAGLMFAIHGSQKILGWPPSDMHPPIASIFGVSGIIELVCGLLIALGLFARWPAFIASGEMAVAFFMAHWPKGWNPVANKGEAAVLYCFFFLYVFARGSGIWSLDSLLSQGRRAAPGR
ncbi:MAG TPA: DoxX family protein [Thermoanaerobaculia bacterium]|nr:DoxX family protein [Thermoanaerobaculia bacterium]